MQSASLVLMVVAACYSPTLRPGSPCDEVHSCAPPLLCTLGTCETLAAESDAHVVAAPDAACVPTGPEICGDGIDQDCSGSDAPCVANDRPGGAIDVTAGGTFGADLLLARDDLANNGCNRDGGNDVFYDITLAAPQVYYFDTFSSGFDTSLRVFPGLACSAVTSAMTPAGCNDDACGTAESQLAAALPAGTSCLVVDKNFNNGLDPDKGTFALHVVPGGRTGTALPAGTAMLTGDTCVVTDVWQADTGCGVQAMAKDVAYYFLACPAKVTHVDASTCKNPANTHFDTVVYVRSPSGPDLACQDDILNTALCAPRPDRPDGQPDGSIVSDVRVTGPGLFWVVVDGYNMSACGGYQLDTTLR